MTSTQPFISPLRYPGSKRKLVEPIWIAISQHQPRPNVLLEPLCGGASVSLNLLATTRIAKALINDLNPMVHAFWRVCLYHPTWLIEDMHTTPVTVANWHRIRDAHPRSLRDKAFACLYLNRTTFSGLMHQQSGPIGGKNQSSKYKIDCRFNKTMIEKRIRHVQQLHVEGKLDIGPRPLGYKEFIEQYQHTEDTVCYLDPPYVQKGKNLYDWSLDVQKHKELFYYLSNEMKGRWVLSYDDAPLVRELYKDYQRVDIALYYTMGRNYKHRTGRPNVIELVFTNAASPHREKPIRSI